MDKDYWSTIKVKTSTQQKIKHDIRREFVENNPQFEHMELTYDFLLNKLITYYLED